MSDASLTFDQMLSPEKFNGENCWVCKNGIYGDGFRVVMTIDSARSMLPGFKETEVRLCLSCGNQVNKILDGNRS